MANKRPDRPEHEISIVVSDLQMPYERVDALDFVGAIKKKVGATKVYGIGDTFDFQNWGRWAKAKRPPDLMSAEKELLLNRAKVKKWVKVVPVMASIVGNHCRRFIDSMRFDSGVPESIMSDTEIMATFLGTPPGWTFHDSIIIPTPGTFAPIELKHGHENGVNKNSTTWFRNSTLSGVIGHYHCDAKIDYSADRNVLRFFAVIGCLMDGHSMGARYSHTNTRKQIYSVLVIDRGIPHLYPLRLDENGEWQGV